MRISLRYIIRLLSAFIKKFGVILLLGMAAGIIIFVLFTLVIPKINGKHSKRIGLTGRYQADNLPTNISNKISSGLTFVNENQIVEPKIAKSWETSDKGKTWTFHLDGKFKWQDGDTIKSNEIVYNFSGVKIEYPDDQTIKFTLQDPYSPFPSVVSKPIFKRGLLGAGEWTVKKASISSGYIKELILKDKKGNTLIYKFYPTEERTKLAMKLGQVDSIENIYTPDPFTKWNTLTIKKNYINYLIVTLFFNYKDSLLSDKSLRQALIYAIKKDKFPNRAISPIPESSWAYNPQVKDYEYNPTRAKELIDALPKESKQNLDIKLVTTPSLLDTAEAIVQNWKDIGIKSSVLVSSVIPAEFQAFLAIYEAPNDPDQYTIWHSKQEESNISNYQNIRIDKLLEDGRAELNFDERRRIYLDFQRFLIEDSPAAFLYHPTIYTIEKK